MEEQELLVVAKNRTKVLLKKYEIDLLEQIMIHRWMASKSIHQFIQKSSPKKLHPNSISNRLKTFIDKGILIRRTKNISTTRATVNQYFYLLTRESLRILVNRKIIDRTESKRYYRQAMKMDIPSPHTVAMSFLANQIIVECNIPTKIKGLSHSRGTDIPVIVGETTNRLEFRNLVIPDWIFQFNKNIICFEMDTGSQSQKVIRNKILRYEKLKPFLMEKNIILTVFFTVLDTSLDRLGEKGLDDRSKRVASIKNTVLQTVDSGLIYYVASAKQTPVIVNNWVMEKINEVSNIYGDPFKS